MIPGETGQRDQPATSRICFLLSALFIILFSPVNSAQNGTAISACDPAVESPDYFREPFIEVPEISGPVSQYQVSPFAAKFIEVPEISGPVSDTPTAEEASANGVTLFATPLGFWLAPSKWNGSLYGPSVLDANWHFTQWQNPGNDLPPFEGDQTATASVRVVDVGGKWEIAQNGERLSLGAEFAVFAEANRTVVYPGYPPAGDGSLALSHMRYLNHSLGFMSKYERVIEDSALVKGGFVTAVVFENIRNGHKFFYQLELRPVNKEPCQSWWSWSGPRWGYGDTVLSYGVEIPELNERVFYRFDLLPRLKEIFQDSAEDFDRNLANWVIIGTYHGSHVWGNVVLTGIWDSFSLRTKYDVSP